MTADVKRYNDCWVGYKHIEMRETQNGNYVLSTDYDTLRAECEKLREALQHFADYPLEEFGRENARDSHPLFGANEWKLNVAHIKAARAALK